MFSSSCGVTAPFALHQISPGFVVNDLSHLAYFDV